MKWRHWAILIVLVLLNYIIFSTAFTLLAARRQPQPLQTRTPQPTFTSVPVRVVGWIVVPTSTRPPTRTPGTAAAATAAVSPAAPAESTATDAPPAATATPQLPTNTPTVASVVHIVQEGETLSLIAQQYGVTVEAIAQANGLTDPSLIVIGQELIIPLPGAAPPTPTPNPTKKPPTPKPTKKPAPTATPTTALPQFTAELIWDPLVAPNCSGPAISKLSVIKDRAGNPVNGARVEVSCYDNTWLSHPSGTPGEYDPGHYDFAFGQSVPQNWSCTARVFDLNGQPVASSEIARIEFDTNDCKPDGSGHQVAILNWTKNW